MRKFLFSASLLLIGLLILLFLLANREGVFISLDPINTENPAVALGPMPLWVALMATMLVGYILGGIGMWISGKGTRRKARDRKYRIQELERELATARPAQQAPKPVAAIEKQDA